MTTDDRTITYGFSKIIPTNNVTTGSFGTWTLTFIVGMYGIDDGGHIKIAWRDVSNWGRPQFQHLADKNYCTVNTTGNAKLDVCFEERGYIHPWRPCLIIKLNQVLILIMSRFSKAMVKKLGQALFLEIS